MRENNFKKLILEFLDGEITEHEEGIYDLTVNLKDVNAEINSKKWEESLAGHLKPKGYKISFTYGDDNWSTIHIEEELTRDDNVMKTISKRDENGEYYFIHEFVGMKKPPRTIKKGNSMYNIFRIQYEKYRAGIYK